MGCMIFRRMIMRKITESDFIIEVEMEYKHETWNR